MEVKTSLAARLYLAIKVITVESICVAIIPPPLLCTLVAVILWISSTYDIWVTIILSHLL